MKYLPYILIVIALLIAGGIYIDRTSKQKPGNNPSVVTNDKKVTGTELQNYGPAPEFTGIVQWLNTSEPLKMPDLRGKVVLVDFWTYSCINCIRTLPYITKWDETYRDKGLVIIGIHTPEFEFEKVTNNVETAIKRFKINYPVAQDNSYKTWTAFDNHYWPAKYLIDKEGNVRYRHFGEGDYETTERAIQELLGLAPLQMTTNTEEKAKGIVKTPEIYFGTSRIENLAPEQSASLTAKRYQLPTNLKLNHFALEGEWKFENEKAILTSGNGKIRLKYHASNVHMVAQTEKPIAIIVRLDGDIANKIIVKDSMLYDLILSDLPGEHILEIEIPESGLEAFTFTFG